MKTNWDDKVRHEHKTEARQIALDWPCKPKKRVVLLPGFKMQCLIDGLESNLFDGNTFFYIVEREEGTMKEIARRVKEMKLKANLHLGELETLKVQGGIDFAFLDFIGPMTRGCANWLRRELVPSLSPNADLSFTFMYCYRNTHFAHECDNFFKQHYKYSYDVSCRTQVCDAMINVYQSTISLIFNDFDFRLLTPVYYRDRSPMTLLRVKGLTRRAKPADQTMFDCFWSFVNGFAEPLHGPNAVTPEKVDDALDLKRHLAAVKSWITRRRNEKKGGVKWQESSMQQTRLGLLAARK